MMAFLLHATGVASRPIYKLDIYDFHDAENVDGIVEYSHKNVIYWQK